MPGFLYNAPQLMEESSDLVQYKRFLWLGHDLESTESGDPTQDVIYCKLVLLMAWKLTELHILQCRE